MDPRGTVGRIYKTVYYTMLHTKYEISGPNFFFMFFQFSPDLVCCIPNIEALTIVVSEKMSLHVTLVNVYADLVGFTQV